MIERAGQRIVLPATYLAAGHLDHGYAITVHKGQGATYEVALLYGDEHLYAEAGYTALTRGRQQTRSYVLIDGSPDARPGFDQIAYRLGRSQAERAAIECQLPEPPATSQPPR